jgi:hypothetical protein
MQYPFLKISRRLRLDENHSLFALLWDSWKGLLPILIQSAFNFSELWKAIINFMARDFDYGFI